MTDLHDRAAARLSKEILESFAAADFEKAENAVDRLLKLIAVKKELEAEFRIETHTKYVYPGAIPASDEENFSF